MKNMDIVERFLREIEEASWVFGSSSNSSYLSMVDPLYKFFLIHFFDSVR